MTCALPSSSSAHIRTACFLLLLDSAHVLLYSECREHVQHAQKLLSDSEAPHTSSLASSKKGQGPIDSAAKLNAMFPMLSVEFLEELLERFGQSCLIPLALFLFDFG